MPNLPNIPLSRSALLGVLSTIQNGPTFAGQDIMSFAGMCSTAEVSEHVMACFGRLTVAEKGRALAELQRRIAPVAAYQPAMVPQPVQQQQVNARETAAEWAARMDRQSPRRAPHSVPEDSPAMKAGLAIAAEAGRRYGEAQLAVRAEHDIAAAPVLAGRYGRAA